MRPKVSASIVFLLFFQFAFAQQDFSKVSDWVNKNLTDLGGRAVLMVYKDGKFAYAQNFNNLTKAQQNRGKIKAKVQGKDVEEVLQDYTSTTRERIASSSKWLTAALLMTYIDENKVRLTDSVGKFLPVMTKYGKGGIKVWQCLNHTTGIKSGGLRDMLNGMKNVKSMYEAIEQIAMLPMEGTPGKYFHYSNTGLQIVAGIIEKVSEKDFETAFKERIADPLEMKNTDFGKIGVPLAAGGAYSTTEDYMNFLIMLLNEGEFKGKRIISKALVYEMQKNRLARDVELAYSPDEAGTWGYGFGEWIMDAPLAVSEKKDAMPNSKRGIAVSSPGLFGSFPWIDNDKKYCAFLFVYNLKNKERHEKYRELKELVDNAVR
ncbi:MAG: beta-lactamase family protein [Chitinophagaceae bacterium]|nr:beta-lactamase family protein [Chitinophagaceae bacterium]